MASYGELWSPEVTRTGVKMIQMSQFGIDENVGGVGQEGDRLGALWPGASRTSHLPEVVWKR